MGNIIHLIFNFELTKRMKFGLISLKAYLNGKYVWSMNCVSTYRLSCSIQFKLEIFFHNKDFWHYSRMKYFFFFEYIKKLNDKLWKVSVCTLFGLVSCIRSYDMGKNIKIRFGFTMFVLYIQKISSECFKHKFSLARSHIELRKSV